MGYILTIFDLAFFTFYFSNNYQILFLYSKGMSTRYIQETIYQMFYCDLDKDTISRITDKIILKIVMWQQRPLEFVYPIMYIDIIRFKIREDSV